jgi:hypothetical protein
MRLYHTSDRIIREPDISMGRRNADFGHGFYLAADEEFAGSEFGAALDRMQVE